MIQAMQTTEGGYLKQRDATKQPRMLAPAGACDCHAHVFGNPAKYPFTEPRGYTPLEASAADYRRMLDTLGITRAVVVQPSVYGQDNSCTLDAVRELGLDRARGIVTIDTAITNAELESMNANGVRGVRFNAISKGTVNLDQVEEIAARIAPFGWHIQTYVRPDTLRKLAPVIVRLPVPVVLDHLAGLSATTDFDQPDVKMVLKLLETGQVWVKLTSYRASLAGHPYQDTSPLARLFLKQAPDRCVWGSDWPHPDLKGYMPDDGDLFDLLFEWAHNENELKRVLVSNPARLYGFV